MKISIVIPCYNGEHYIEKCLDSFYNQCNNNLDLEIIFINDGSFDNSFQKVNNYVGNSKIDLKIFDRSNVGLSASRNFGLEIATGSYVWFVDVDDFVDLFSLCHFEEILSKCTPDIIAFGANKLVVDEKSRFSKEFNKVGLLSSESFFIDNSFYVCVPFYLYKKEFLEREKLKFWNGIFHEDYEFTPKAILKANNIYATNEILYTVFYSDNSITRSYNSKKSFDMLIIVQSLRKLLDSVTNDEVKRKIYLFIAMGINNSLSNVKGMDHLTLKSYTSELKKISNYYLYFFKILKLKYFCEGILMFISTDLLVRFYLKFKK